MMLLYIVGGVWIGGIALFVLALGAAARKPMPAFDPAEMCLDPENACDRVTNPGSTSLRGNSIRTANPALAGLAH